MPQPVDKNIATEFGHHIVKSHPEHAIRIAAICAAWAEVEEQLAELMIVLMQADQEAAAAFFYSLNGNRPRWDALEAVAAIVMPAHLQPKFEHLLKKIKKRARERNDLAHARWACCDKRPGQILSMPSKFHSGGPAISYTLADLDRRLEWMEMLQCQMIDFIEAVVLAQHEPPQVGDA